MKRITTILILTVFVACQKPQDIAEMTAPVAYALVRNAVKNKKPNGEMKIQVHWLDLKASDDWYNGTIRFDISMPEYPNKSVGVQYTLNGTHNATAIVQIPNKPVQQYNVNLYDSAVITTDSQTIENEFQNLGNQLSKELKNEKVAIFEFVDLNDKVSVLGERISESLITALSKKQITIVERRLFTTIDKELNFNRSGLTINDYTKQVGEWLGADVVISGTIKLDKHNVIINARAINLSTATVIATSQTIIPIYLFKSDDFRIINR